MKMVSVIIPAYNQSRYLGDAIQSVLNQTCSDFEIIVVDDGSTDDTGRVAHQFDPAIVHYFYQENAGLSAARNTGIRNASGEFITYLDSDDLFAPRKLELLVGEFERNPQMGFVAGQAILIDENGSPLDRIFDTPVPPEPSDLLYWNPFHVCSVMVRREWQQKAGYFDESLRAYEDWDMWLRLARLGCPMGWVPEPVSMYRFHTAQMTRDRQRMTTATFAVLEKTFQDPDLPAAWKQKKDRAYSNAYLRSAIQAYRTGDYQDAQADLAQAVALDPQLAAEEGAVLARRFSAVADLPKVQDKLDFLESIYNHLPPILEPMSRKRRAYLAQTAVDIGFASYEKGEFARARLSLFRALRYQPLWLTNRGVLSILLKTSLPLRGTTEQSEPKLQPLK